MSIPFMYQEFMLYSRKANYVEKPTSWNLSVFWRRRWDSNPRGVSPKRFSRPPRYDHFDTSPCIHKPIKGLVCLLVCSAPPRHVLLRCPKFFGRIRSKNFDRCHSLLLAVSAAGSARKRPHFDTSPCIHKPIKGLVCLLVCSAPPRHVLLRCPKFFGRIRSKNFDRCHSLLLAVSAAGSARKRPHFDTSPCIFKP